MRKTASPLKYFPCENAGNFYSLETSEFSYTLWNKKKYLKWFVALINFSPIPPLNACNTALNIIRDLYVAANKPHRCAKSAFSLFWAIASALLALLQEQESVIWTVITRVSKMMLIVFLKISFKKEVYEIF